MIRLLFWNLFLFILPFVVMWLWGRWIRLRHPVRVVQSRVRFAAICGVVLVFISLVVWRFTSGAPPDRVYVPPKAHDGTITPGHFMPAPVKSDSH